MKDVYELLRQKELEMSQLEIEVEALRIAAPLLSMAISAMTINQPRPVGLRRRAPPRFPRQQIPSHNPSTPLSGKKEPWVSRSHTGLIPLRRLRSLDCRILFHSDSARNGLVAAN